MGLFKRRNKDLFTVPENGPATSDAGSGFRMVVDEVFFISGRGTVVTGRVGAGSVAIGGRVTIERAGRPPLASEIAGIEMYRRKAELATVGENVGLQLRGLDRDDIASGDVVRT